MSEKHLTESAWKTLASKHKITDTALPKALAAYAKAPEDDSKARLAALADVQKHAESLRKEHKREKELNDYLGEVLDETAKQRKAVQASEGEAKEAEVEEEEEETVDPTAVKERMVSLMNKVKGRDPAEIGFGFRAAIVGDKTAVLLAEPGKMPSKKALLSLAPGATLFPSGTCIWEKEAHTFVIDNPPGGFVKRLKEALLAETNVSYKVRLKSSDGTTIEDGEEMKQGTIPPPPREPVGPVEGQTEFLNRLRAEKHDIDRVIAAGVGVSAEAAALLAEIGTLVKERKIKDATAALDRLDQLVKQGLNEMAAAGDPGEMFKRRMAALAPKIKEAVAANSPAAGELRLKTSEAVALSKQSDFVNANAALDRIEQLLGGAEAAETNVGRSSEEKGEFVIYTQSRLQWDEARKKVQAELRKLEAEILATCKYEDDFDEISGGTKNLYEMLEELDDRLGDKLDEALGADTPEKRRAFHDEAKGIVDEYLAFVDGDDLIKEIDTNGFVGVAVKSTLTETLNDLAKKLSAPIGQN